MATKGLIEQALESFISEMTGILNENTKVSPAGHVNGNDTF
jgi:hypothetical protein